MEKKYSQDQARATTSPGRTSIRPCSNRTMRRGAETLDFSVGEEISDEADIDRRSLRESAHRARAPARTRPGLIANWMALRPWWLAVAAAAALLACATGAQADIQLQLRFDNEVLDPKATPDFTCYSYTLNRWVGCRVQKSGAPGAYVLETLGPGKYQMHVSVDENPANPRRFPGDYETQLSFEVTATGPERLVVDLARLIHLTRPGDNARAIEGMLTSCTKQPQFDTPRYSWGPTATVDFAWEPIAAGAEYRYTLVARTCGQAGAGRDILSGQTTKTTAALSVRPTTDGEYYVFRVEAWKDDRLVGDLYTHDGGAHSWNYRFRVRNASLPRWAYLAAGAGLVVLLLGARRLFGVIDSEGRRRRVRPFGRGV